jgi:hypothetical protein
MPKYYVEKQVSILRVTSAEVEAEDEQDARNIFYGKEIHGEIADFYEKVRDCDWEIHEVKD